MLPVSVGFRYSISFLTQALHSLIVTCRAFSFEKHVWVLMCQTFKKRSSRKLCGFSLKSFINILYRLEAASGNGYVIHLQSLKLKRHGKVCVEWVLSYNPQKELALPNDA